MKKIFIISLCMTFAVEIISLSCDAAVKYVDCSLPSSGTGTSWAQAFNNIQSGINAAATYDQVWVKKGTCALSATINLNKTVFVLGGFAGNETDTSQRQWWLPANATIIDGQNTVRCVNITADSAYLDGFSITKGKSTDYAGGIHVSGSVGPFTVINNCKVYQNVGGATQGGGGISSKNSQPTIVNSVINNNTAFWGAGIYVDTGAISVVNSTIYGNTATGGQGGGGYYSVFVTNPRSVITNSILWGNTAAQIVASEGTTGNPTVTYSDVQGGFTGTGNKIIAPVFVNAAAFDFHLQSTASCCIDQGTNSPTALGIYYVFGSLVTATDFEGDPRQYGSNIDIGADEYVPDTSPPTGSVSINSGATYTNNRSVTLTISASDSSGVSQMCVNETPSYGTWVGYAPSMAMNLTNPDDGLKTVYIWFKDSLGNANPEGSPFSDTIILDTAAPTNGILVATEGSQILLNWPGFSDGSGSGIASYKLVKSDTSPPADCGGAGIYTGSNISYTDTAVTPGTTYYYRVCAIDNATNTSSGAVISGISGQPAVRIVRIPGVPYTSIQSAYDAAQSLDVIQARSTDFYENPVFDAAITVEFKGGYDPAYSGNISQTRVRGSLSIIAGTVTIERLTLL